MLCCSLAGAAALARWRKARVVAVGALVAFGVMHAGHYVARAEAHERSVLAEILAAPICTGQ